MEFDLEFLLGEINDMSARLEHLTFAIVTASTNPTATDYLINGAIELAREQGKILQQLDEYHLSDIDVAQQTYNAMRHSRQQVEREATNGRSKSRRRHDRDFHFQQRRNFR